MFGLELSRTALEPSLPEYNPKAWCLWCALHTLYVQYVIFEWSHELRSGRLFWLPDRLVAAIFDIGLSQLVCSEEEERDILSALRLLYRVKWERFDPASSIRPSGNDFGSPVFHSGVVVALSSARWDLECVGGLICYPRPSLRRDNPCGPDLRQWRDSHCGNGLVPQDFFRPPRFGVRVDLTRIGGPSPSESRCYRNAIAHY